MIAPPVMTKLEGEVFVFANHASQEIKIDVIAGSENQKGTLKLDLPDTWKMEPANHEFSLTQKGESKSLNN